LHGFPAKNARLNFKGRLAWLPAYQMGEWIQVDLGNVAKVTKIATQGNNGSRRWIKKYKVSYSLDGIFFKFYQVYQDRFYNVDRVS